HLRVEVEIVGPPTNARPTGKMSAKRPCRSYLNSTQVVVVGWVARAVSEEGPPRPKSPSRSARGRPTLQKIARLRRVRLFRPHRHPVPGGGGIRRSLAPGVAGERGRGEGDGIRSRADGGPSPLPLSPRKAGGRG